MQTAHEMDRSGAKLAINTPPIVSPQAWEAAREEMLVKEKAFSRARDALAAERRRMPWMAVEKAYAFEGPAGFEQFDIERRHMRCADHDDVLARCAGFAVCRVIIERLHDGPVGNEACSQYQSVNEGRRAWNAIETADCEEH